MDIEKGVNGGEFCVLSGSELRIGSLALRLLKSSGPDGINADSSVDDVISEMEAVFNNFMAAKQKSTRKDKVNPLDYVVRVERDVLSEALPHLVASIKAKQDVVESGAVSLDRRQQRELAGESFKVTKMSEILDL